MESKVRPTYFINIFHAIIIQAAGTLYNSSNTCFVCVKCAIFLGILSVFYALTNGGRVSISDRRHVVRADREAVERIWCTVVLLCQVTRLDVWSGHNYGTEIHQACRMAETSALTVLQLCRKAWRET